MLPREAAARASVLRQSIGPRDATKKGTGAGLSPISSICEECLGFGCLGRRGSGFFAGGALDASSFATQVAQVVEAGAAHTALANYVNRSDGGRVQRENALHSRAETHAAHGKRGTAGSSLLRDHHAFKRLDAFLDFLAFAFQQADVYPHGVAGAKLGEVFAQLRFVQLTNYRIHFLCSLQTHSGGASTSKANYYYRQDVTEILVVIRVRALRSEVRPVSPCLLCGLLAAPFGHFGMMPADQDIGHFPAAVFRRTRVVGEIQKQVTSGEWRVASF